MATIFHLALAADWAAAQESGTYTTSTRGRTLAEEGFIHASRGDQWPAIRQAFYADVAPVDLVLLQIDTDLLDVPVVEEPPTPEATETFPHIYGPLPVAAVTRAIPLGQRASEPTPVAGGQDLPSRPTETFSRVYLREVFFNVTLVCVVLLLATAGLAVGRLANEDAGPGIGGLAGLVAGVAVAVLLYRRRHHARPAD